MREDKIFILAYGRSGGSSLQLALTAAIGGKRLDGEFFSWEGPRQEVVESDCSHEKVKTMAKRRVDNFSRAGVKLNARTFSYCDNEASLMNTVIDFYGRVVLNGRRNLLKRKISEVISVNTDIWHIDGEEEREKVKQVDSWEVDIDNLREDIERKENLWDEYTDFIEKNEIPYYQIDYEELYQTENVKHRVFEIRKLVDWLGFDFDEDRIGRIRRVLSPERKYNNKETYQLIENIEEVNEELGPEYGYLF